ncbi:Acetyltransferase (isoleucine patch superfamily) [Flavobacterium fluvii]|uniref:Acetyltransferase (Isoleucine patch superfamily) n=1 Tax=Flavobacterium fluvii TaxID=468056 RepID=A0A1M5IKQ9_9FLAO|nr:CatB-related O-acetyltransferase [Flavobacterium fluvii]SHG28825.1 Acetyltransferase (isoleucine patch superfamily) [Flavobacterium fluvii]
MNNIFRLLLLPLGLFYRLFFIALDGSRDLSNKMHYRKSIIDKGCCIDSYTTIEPYCHILDDVFIANSSIASYSYIGKHSIVQNATIGSFCSIANDVFIGTGKHPIDHFSTSTLFYRKKNTFNIELVSSNLVFDEYEKIKIGSDVWIGTRAIILDGISIGHGAIIAANSVVTKDVPPYAIVGGIPAKIIKYRFDDFKIKKLIESDWWSLSLNEIKQKIRSLNNM